MGMTEHAVLKAAGLAVGLLAISPVAYAQDRSSSAPGDAVHPPAVASGDISAGHLDPPDDDEDANGANPI